MDTSAPDFQSLNARLGMLEQQYRGLKSEVVTEKLVLVDASGKTRATLDMSEGEPRLDLYDTNGNSRVCLRVSADGPSLRLWDAKTKQALDLTVDGYGPGVTLVDTKGNASVAVTAEGSGGPANGPKVSLFDSNGNTSVLLAVTEKGPVVSLYDATGRQRLNLDIEHNGWFPSGTPGLTLREPNGTAIVTVRAIEDSPSLCLVDPNNPHGNTSASIIVDREGPSLLCVKEGKVLWSAP